MELYLHHGRAKPEQAMEEWGPSGPRLQGVKGIHQTYGNPVNVFFVSVAAKEEARRLTGWDPWDSHALTMRWEQDCVHVADATGTAVLYGDWGLM